MSLGDMLLSGGISPPKTQPAAMSRYAYCPAVSADRRRRGAPGLFGRPRRRCRGPSQPAGTRPACPRMRAAAGRLGSGEGRRRGPGAAGAGGSAGRFDVPVHISSRRARPFWPSACAARQWPFRPGTPRAPSRSWRTGSWFRRRPRRISTSRSGSAGQARRTSPASPQGVERDIARPSGASDSSIDLCGRAVKTFHAADPRGRDRVVEPGAEGATAPETLRPKDRGELALWKAAALDERRPPTGVTSASSAGGNLSGPGTEGARTRADGPA